MKQRFIALLLICVAIAGAVLVRALTIQLGRDPRLEAMAKRQFQSSVLIRPRRGTIVDRNGEPLAVNAEIYSLAANPSKIPHKKTLARLLSKALELPAHRLLDRIEDRKEKKEFAWIKRHLTEAELNHLKHLGLIHSDGELAQGLWLVKESKRIYPHGELAAHILGDVNLDSEGLEGLELWANQKLQGKLTQVPAVRDALGRPTFIDAVAAQHVKDGESVELTIDASLQYSVEQELKAAVHRTGARSGTVIVMNAVNGEILAMANDPSFNPNQRVVSAERRRNRALTDGYEPGSTMKPILLASALSHGAKITDSINCENGSFTVQGKKISEAEAHEKFGVISLKKIIQVSSNVGAAKLALRVGADHYFNTLRSYGFAARTGTGFPGEIAGRVPARKDWQPLSLANIGFGQGLLATPMQMLRAYASFANGGWLVQPTLVKNPLPGYVPEAPRRVIPEKVAASVIEALESVTEEKGTGIKARLEGYRVAGKTGTAQMVDPGSGKYSKSKYVASFIGFPVGVEPKIVIFAAIHEPHGVYYASETAAPLFREVLAAVANRFSLPTQLPVTTEKRALASRTTDHLKWSLAKVVDPAPLVSEAMVDGKIQWRLPDLRGLTPREAMRLFQGRAFQIELHGTGVVRSQIPEEGKTLADGATLKLILAEP